MIDAVRQLIDHGIKWRAIPPLDALATVNASFARWRDAWLVAELHDRLREAVRCSEGREDEPSAAVVDLSR